MEEQTKPEIVYIRWLDSGSVDGHVWQFKDDWTCAIHECESVGILVKHDETEVVIAQSVNSDQYGRLFAIPTKSILSLDHIPDARKKVVS